MSFETQIRVSLIDEVSAGAKRIAESLKGITEKAKEVGTTMAAVTAMVGGPALLGLGAWAASGVKDVISFDDALRKVIIDGHIAAEHIGTLKSHIEDISTRVPYSVDKLSEFAEAGASIARTLPEKDRVNFLSDFTEHVAKFGYVAEIGARDAATLAARIMRAYPEKGVPGMYTMLDQLQELHERSLVPTEVLGRGMLGVQGFAKAFGIPPEQVAAMIAHSGGIGLPTGTGSRGGGMQLFGSLFKDINKLGKKDLPGFERATQALLGVDFKGFKRKFEADAMGTLQQISQALATYDNPADREKLIHGLFPRESDYRNLMPSLLDFGAMEEYSDVAAESPGAVGKHFVERMRTLLAQIELADNKIMKLKRHLAEPLANVEVAWKTALGNIAQWLDGLLRRSPRIRELTSALTVFGTAAGGLLGGALIGKGLAFLGVPGAQALEMLGPIAWAAAAAAAAIYLMWNNWQHFSEVLRNPMEFPPIKFTSFTDFLDTLDKIENKINGVVQAAVKLAGTLLFGQKPYQDNALNFFTGKLDPLSLLKYQYPESFNKGLLGQQPRSTDSQAGAPAGGSGGGLMGWVWPKPSATVAPTTMNVPVELKTSVINPASAMITVSVTASPTLAAAIAVAGQGPASNAGSPDGSNNQHMFDGVQH